MEWLYVCHFSNGHIKVGRSIDPTGRIASHADRVSCLGIELVEHFVAVCDGSAMSKEAALIARCTEAATRRNKNEWFEGLDYPQVCEWATTESIASDAAPVGRWVDCIARLQAMNLTQMQIAAACNTKQSTISDLALGKTVSPSYDLGSALLVLHERKRIEFQEV